MLDSPVHHILTPRMHDPASAIECARTGRYRKSLEQRGPIAVEVREHDSNRGKRCAGPSTDANTTDAIAPTA